jgi:hypothetical protein
MRFRLEERVRAITHEHHDHIVDSFAYMVAGMEVVLLNEYCVAHVRRKPWWMPEFVYRWLVSQLLVLSRFRK